MKIEERTDKTKNDAPKPAESDAERHRTAERHATEGRPVHAERTARGDDVVTEASEDSFPASDPPSFTPTTSVSTKDADDDSKE